MERPREGGVVGLVVGVVRANHLTLEGTQIMGGLWKGSLRARCAQGIRINDRAVSRWHVWGGIEMDISRWHGPQEGFHRAVPWRGGGKGQCGMRRMPTAALGLRGWGEVWEMWENGQLSTWLDCREALSSGESELSEWVEELQDLIINYEISVQSTWWKIWEEGR